MTLLTCGCDPERALRCVIHGNYGAVMTFPSSLPTADDAMRLMVAEMTNPGGIHGHPVKQNGWRVDTVLANGLAQAVVTLVHDTGQVRQFVLSLGGPL